MRRTGSSACDQSIQTRSEATPSFVPQSSRPSRARSAMHGMPLCSKRPLLYFAPLLRTVPDGYGFVESQHSV